jgi:hypothetical protein
MSPEEIAQSKKSSDFSIVIGRLCGLQLLRVSLNPR